jgi:[histone H3]-lysine9 N-trimethyltransferase SUV39H
VRALQKIPQHSFVCEYIGELLISEDAESRGKKYDKKGISFLLDLDLAQRNCKYT